MPTNSYKDSLFAYRNDWQTFQLVIVPFTDDDLVINSCYISDKGEAVEIFKGEYVFCEPAVYSPEQKGWVLDPLLPFDNPDSLIIQPNQNRCLFFNYFIPEEYEKNQKYFHIVLETNRGQINYDLCIEVRPEAILNQISLKTAFSFDINWVNWFYADSTLVWDNAKYYYDFLLKYKISPTFIYKNDYQKTWPLFRDWKSLNFSIQTVGRIMRMPEIEKKHYNLEPLNNSYIFTNIENIHLKEDATKDYLKI